MIYNFMKIKTFLLTVKFYNELKNNLTTGIASNLIRDVNNRDWQQIEITLRPTVPMVMCSQFKSVYRSNKQLYRIINS